SLSCRSRVKPRQCRSAASFVNAVVLVAVTAPARAGRASADEVTGCATDCRACQCAFNSACRYTTNCGANGCATYCRLFCGRAACRCQCSNACNCQYKFSHTCLHWTLCPSATRLPVRCVGIKTRFASSFQIDEQPATGLQLPNCQTVPCFTF